MTPIIIPIPIPTGNCGQPTDPRVEAVVLGISLTLLIGTLLWLFVPWKKVFRRK